MPRPQGRESDRLAVETVGRRNPPLGRVMATQEGSGSKRFWLAVGLKQTVRLAMIAALLDSVGP